MRPSFLLILILLAIAPSVPAFGQQPSGEQTPPVISDELIKAVETEENRWMEHLENPPEIPMLHPPDESKTESREDFWRFRILELREKSRANRIWHQYWKEQAERIGAILPLYRKILDRAKSENALEKQPSPYSFRLQGLSLWLKLAEDKMENQDAYLQAIDKEKEAYESRLDSADVQIERSKPAEVGAREKEGGESSHVEGEPTPYREYKERLRELGRLKALQAIKESQARNDAQMSVKLIEASEILLKAALADLALAEREQAIALEQVAGAGQDRAWKTCWKDTEKRIAEKIMALGAVADAQKKSLEAQMAEKAYFEAILEIKKNRIADLENRILEEKKRLGPVLVLTAREVLLEKGLIVLLYLLGAFGFLWIAKRVSRLYRRRVDDGDDSRLTDREQRVETLSAVVMSIIRLAVYFVTLLLLLDALGVNIAPLMGAFAIFGLAISFGSQNLVRDLVAGFFMLLEHQLSVGDVVTLGGITGTVEIISLRRVVLRDIKGAVHSIPNGSIGTVTNNTHGWARAIVDVGVGYGDDLRVVKEVFDRVGKEMFEDPVWKPQLLEAPGFVGVMELGDSAVVVRVWAKTRSPDQWAVERELNLRLKMAADENGIEIPFPQTVVTMANPG